MKMSHKRKILLFKSCLLVTYQFFFFFFYTYIFLIHKIHHKISTARNPDKHQPLVCEQDNWTHSSWGTSQWWPVPRGSSTMARGTRLPLSPAPSGAACDGPAGTSWCPVMPSWQHSSPCSPAAAPLPDQNYHGGSAGGKGANGSSLGTPHHSCPGVRAHSREGPWEHWGALGITVPCHLLVALHPLGTTQLHSSCPTLP